MTPIAETIEAIATPYRCIGCGHKHVPKRHTYCRNCRRRVEAGIPTDDDDHPTQKECRMLARRMKWLDAIPDDRSLWVRNRRR